MNEDLAQYVTTTLADFGHPNPTSVLETLPPIAHLDLGMQMCMINTQLRYAYTAIPGDTTNQRYCILDRTDVNTWKDMMVKTVLRFLAQHAKGAT